MEYKALKYRNATDAYLNVLNHLIRSGKDVPSRLGNTKELSTVITLRNPLEMIPFVYGRRANHFGMLAESLWVMSDIDEVKLIETWNSRLGEFSDDGETLYGAYGPRIAGYHDQLSRVIEIFERDGLDSRQAVISILDPEDVGTITKDFPCNNEVMFKVRDGKLNMTVMNRSNDIHWGLFGVNFPQFALLQNYVASRIGVRMGVQTHVSDSLHLYMESTPHQEITSRMTFSGQKRFQFYNFNTRNARDSSQPYDIFGDKTHSVAREIFEYCLQEDSPTRAFGDSPFLSVVIPLLILYRQIKEKVISREEAVAVLRNRIEESIKLVDPTPKIDFPADWVLACYQTLCRQSGSNPSLVKIAYEEFNRMVSLTRFQSVPVMSYLRDS